MTPLTAPGARPDSPLPALARTTPARPADATVIAADFETFLRMLTTQLQNQDPTNPMDPGDFAVQLATFAAVEQAVRTNQLLEGMMARSALGELAGVVGMAARAPGPLRFDGAALTLSIPAVEGAETARLVVRNALGQVVDTAEVPVAGGLHLWRGLGPDGMPLPPGDYAFEVAGLAGGATVGQSPVQGFAEVVEARRDGGATILVLAGGREVALDAVTALRRPAGAR